LKNGADINKSNYGYSPLFIACENGYLEIVELLLKQGADINKSNYRYSPLFIAC
jgi:ankyrin repeat protein